MTKELVTYVISVVTFSLVFYFTRITNSVDQSLICFKSAILIIHDKTMDDEVKEGLIQQAGVNVFRQFIMILIKGTLILLASALPVFIAGFFGFSTFSDVTNFALRYEVIIITTIVFVVMINVLRKRTSSTKAD